MFLIPFTAVSNLCFDVNCYAKSRLTKCSKDIGTLKRSTLVSLICSTSRVHKYTDVNLKRNERQEMIIATPLDLSFKRATTMNELASKRPQAVRTGKIPSRTATDRFLTCSLWLSNNLLTSTDGLENLAHKVLDDPTYLSWLDLAFNEIEHIGDDITKFPNLKILYLHGNNISDINGVAKLRTLQNLRSLTVHGNPIENVPYYRGYIIHVLPQLAMLDFSAILVAERKKAAPAGFHRTMHDST